MLKNLFSNRLFMGALACFILMVVSGTLYLRYIKRQGQIELERTQERLKQWEAKQKQTEKAPIAPTEKVPEGEKPQDGHIHADGTLHAEPHEAPMESPLVVQPKSDVSAPIGSEPPFHDPYFRMVDGFAITSEFVIAIAPSGVGPDWGSMSAEELAAAIAAINSNPAHPPDDLWPPEDYYYPRGGTTLLSDGDNIWLDDNGHPILRKRGAPYYEIAWSEGFRPPPDVYADYKALHKRYMEVFLDLPDDVSSPELERLASQKEAIEQMYRGPVPSGTFSSGSPPQGMALHVYYAQFTGIKTQMMRNAFEKAGLAYLMDNYDSLKEFAK